jgi:DNA replication and repair protein RecF
LAGQITEAEQVLITAAVPEDVPEQLAARRYQVAAGSVTEDGADG